MTREVVESILDELSEKARIAVEAMERNEVDRARIIVGRIVDLIYAAIDGLLSLTGSDEAVSCLIPALRQFEASHGALIAGDCKKALELVIVS